jgi:uncharacterized protein involved in exopolysaccharide biosynthesis/Mrp family chromosome partitioning ATPase
MKEESITTPKSPIGFQEVLYMLYTRRWIIVALTLTGLAASSIVYFNREILYQTQVKLLVRYVLNRNNIDSYQSQLSPSEPAGDHVIHTEIEILTSADLALSVVDNLGVNQVIPDAPPTATSLDAAGTILSSLDVGAVPGNVIHIHYRNPNPELSVKILKELVTQYAIKHLKIHRSAAAFEAVAQEAQLVKQRLTKTEHELNQIRTKSGITSLTEATGALATQRARTIENLMAAKATLAEQTAKIHAYEKLHDKQPNNANPLPSINDSPASISSSTLAEYQTIIDILDILQKRSIELRVKFKPGNALIQSNQHQLKEQGARLAAILNKYPNLATQATLGNPNAEITLPNPTLEKAVLSSVTARVEAFQTHLREIKEQFNEQYAIGSKIEELERRKQMEDAEYRSLEQSLKEAKVDQALDPSRMPNITVVQQPSKPVETYDKKTFKIVLGLAMSGLVLGVGIALLTEFIFDRRIKRPSDIPALLHLPLLLTIPSFGLKNRMGSILSLENRQKNLENIEPRIDQNSTPRGSKIKPHFILPFTETIRDRIIFNFKVNHVIHKPKLIAVTSTSAGSGCSTIAAGLAKSFSEIKGAKILLVDLSSCKPQDNPVFGEIARHSLHGAMQLAKHQNFKSGSQNLYFAGANARRDKNGAPTFSPLHLYELLPHLRSSDYDYVIFDMPPVDQTSRTLAMAGLMDKVLLILDAQITHKDELKWAYSELSVSQTDVSCVFNKARIDTPRWLLRNS